MMKDTKRGNIMGFIEEWVLPLLDKDDLDYEKVINEIAVKKYVSPTYVKGCLDVYISSGRIKRETKYGQDGKIISDILTIPDHQLISWLQEEEERRKKIQEENKEEVKKADGFITALELEEQKE